MSRVADAIRILQPLSALIDKPLTFVSSGAIENDATVLGAAGIAVRTDDGQPLRPSERRLLQALLEVLGEADECATKYQDLERRFSAMQHENLELLMRNRLLSEVSARDSLTGLYNRWYVMEKIESEMNRSLRHGSPVALLMLDIDHFKRVNDTWGHSAGDMVLKTVGQVLRDSCRVYDVPGRYGGEEFCVVLPETKLGNTPAVAERIRTRVEGTAVRVEGSNVSVTASIGIAGVDAESAEAVLTASALIDRADRALYLAKHRGRNRVEMSC
jgi:diguanylate cyclase (GGDEF)-like protein